jgi:hypothetical protein
MNQIVAVLPHLLISLQDTPVLIDHTIESHYEPRVSQHFLLSTAARSLNLAKVARMSDEEAHDAFQLIRWADTKGEPVCPRTVNMPDRAPVLSW